MTDEQKYFTMKQVAAKLGASYQEISVLTCTWDSVVAL